MASYFAILRGPCTKSDLKSSKMEESRMTAEQYPSTLVIDTEGEGEESMAQVQQIQFPSPIDQLSGNRRLLVPVPQQPVSAA